jgi:hypothetical protein
LTWKRQYEVMLTRLDEEDEDSITSSDTKALEVQGSENHERSEMRQIICAEVPTSLLARQGMAVPWQH